MNTDTFLETLREAVFDLYQKRRANIASDEDVAAYYTYQHDETSMNEAINQLEGLLNLGRLFDL